MQMPIDAQGNPTAGSEPGMSLREYYIGQAMTCIDTSDIDAAVRWCGKFADAILEELKK